MIGPSPARITMGDDAGGTEERIDELEARLAFQDDAIHALDRALSDQQQRISQLEHALKVLLERLEHGEDDIEAPEKEPPPPHY
jgi:SlyX protein